MDSIVCTWNESNVYRYFLSLILRLLSLTHLTPQRHQVRVYEVGRKRKGQGDSDDDDDDDGAEEEDEVGCCRAGTSHVDVVMKKKCSTILLIILIQSTYRRHQGPV